ncbi:hypothetical protein BJ170DRAFT_708094 [Xylariales sp. AK1849]|nr:hypothetical protein BJ170DRAFT_708094 [Xylariales sp. AK1849]
MVSPNDSNDEESDTLLKKGQRACTRKSHIGRFTPFLMFSVSLNILLVGFALFLYVRDPEPSYKNGFLSDLKAVTAEIQLIEHHFSGGVELDEHGHFFTDPGRLQYVGRPKPEIDDAWAFLLSGLNLDLDAADLGPTVRTYQWPESGLYFTGLEVFHSLHCLNRLRQALYPDYYKVFSNPNDPSRENHIAHCINHLRQALQYFSKIHDWARKRRTRFERKSAIVNGSIFVVD